MLTVSRNIASGIWSNICNQIMRVHKPLMVSIRSHPIASNNNQNMSVVNAYHFLVIHFSVIIYAKFVLLEQQIIYPFSSQFCSIPDYMVFQFIDYSRQWNLLNVRCANIWKYTMRNSNNQIDGIISSFDSSDVMRWEHGLRWKRRSLCCAAFCRSMPSLCIDILVSHVEFEQNGAEERAFHSFAWSILLIMIMIRFGCLRVCQTRVR